MTTLYQFPSPERLICRIRVENQIRDRLYILDNPNALNDEIYETDFHLQKWLLSQCYKAKYFFRKLTKLKNNFHFSLLQNFTNLFFKLALKFTLKIYTFFSYFLKNGKTLKNRHLL